MLSVLDRDLVYVLIGSPRVILAWDKFRSSDQQVETGYLWVKMKSSLFSHNFEADFRKGFLCISLFLSTDWANTKNQAIWKIPSSTTTLPLVWILIIIDRISYGIGGWNLETRVSCDAHTSLTLEEKWLWLFFIYIFHFWLSIWVVKHGTWYVSVRQITIELLF